MLLEVIKNTIMITSFVLVIMLVIEYINVQSHGKWIKGIEKHKWRQYLITAFMGIIPGCVGAFGVVSMYIHNLISFGALVTALIATFGDEAFVMFKLIPGVTIKLTLIILAIGIVAGIIVDYFGIGKKLTPQLKSHLEIHNHDNNHNFFDIKNTLNNLRNMSFPRGSLLGGLILIIVGIIAGEFNEGHGHGHGGWDWEQITFLVIMILGLFIITTVSEHFLEAHLWQHVVKKHFMRILLWTFGALLFIEVFTTYFHWEGWIQDNQLIILLLAVLIGIIPESGPHLIFVTLFIDGMIPFGTLLASAIVQDGHGAIPLLAESKKSFFLAKAINIFIGLVVGLCGLYLFR
jgi:hypothetical protein